jgi:hypothetical protein
MTTKPATTRAERRLDQCSACGGWVGKGLWVKYGQKCPMCGAEREVSS